MDIKQTSDHESDRSHEKGAVLHLESMQDHKMSKREQIQTVDAAIARVDVTFESFAHLDIKKILWKMDLRLVPMLTLLYLVSLLFDPGVAKTARRTPRRFTNKSASGFMI